MRANFHLSGLVLLAFAADVTQALKFQVNELASIKETASKVAYGLVKYYRGNITNTPGTIGILGRPYYWWEGGAMWGAMLDYYRLTGDDSYNDITYQALVTMVGPNYDFMVPLYYGEEGNDDQAFWGFAAMTAAEHNWRAPPSPIPSWLQLVINLWNTQLERWDDTSCNGGMRWQIFNRGNGYNYKNTVSNGAFLQLSARLYRYTGNETYAEWAGKVWDWTRQIGFIDDYYNVYDGAGTPSNCSYDDLNRLQFTYSPGIYLYGLAVMYNATNGNALWQGRTQGLLERTAEWFFSPYSNATNVMFEVACETLETCNQDERSFKAYLGRFMWSTTVMAPFTLPTVTKLLTASAHYAAKICDGGDLELQCGMKWYTATNDGNFGPGQQLDALEVIQGLLTPQAGVPLTAESAKFAATTWEDDGTYGYIIDPSTGVRIPRPVSSSTSVKPAATSTLVKSSTAVVKPSTVTKAPSASSSESVKTVYITKTVYALYSEPSPTVSQANAADSEDAAAVGPGNEGAAAVSPSSEGAAASSTSSGIQSTSTVAETPTPKGADAPRITFQAPAGSGAGHDRMGGADLVWAVAGVLAALYL